MDKSSPAHFWRTKNKWLSDDQRIKTWKPLSGTHSEHTAAEQTACTKYHGEAGEGGNEDSLRVCTWICQPSPLSHLSGWTPCVAANQATEGLSQEQWLSASPH